MSPTSQQCKRFLTFRQPPLLTNHWADRSWRVEWGNISTCALNKLHCALWGNIPRRHNTTVEIVYFHPSSCHHSSIFLPANTMTLFLRQLGNVLVITPKTTSLPKHCALRLARSNPGSDHSENKDRKQTNGEATFNTTGRRATDMLTRTFKVENSAMVWCWGLNVWMYRQG